MRTLLLIALLSLAGCGVERDGDSRSGFSPSTGNRGAACTDSSGVEHTSGETWTCSDGCNTCSCRDGRIASTLLYCN